ncbi:MAG TPA: SapC family protein [Rhodocyclaceae bacterium]|nr:SapC family protein [Rhodocyclaceae bacterium]
MASLLFYEKPVALNIDNHKKIRVGALVDFMFSAKTNSVLLTGTEFVEACKEYPIVFIRVDGKIFPVALLGLRDNENVFVDAAGKWDARYIPAFVRRYPFVLAETGGPDLVVCIDEASAVFDVESGEPLFAEDGTKTPFLENALNFMNAYQVQFKRTETFVKHLETMGLLTSMNAKAEMVDGRNFLLNGLLVVDEQKLQGLDKAKAHALLRTGELGWIYAHLLSLSNMGRIVDRLSQRS